MGQLKLSLVLKIGTEVCRGMDYLHKRKVWPFSSCFSQERHVLMIGLFHLHHQHEACFVPPNLWTEAQMAPSCNSLPGGVPGPV
jgi:hypothetical protein